MLKFVAKQQVQLCLWAALFIKFVGEDVAELDLQFVQQGFELVQSQVVLALFHAK